MRVILHDWESGLECEVDTDSASVVDRLAAWGGDDESEPFGERTRILIAGQVLLVRETPAEIRALQQSGNALGNGAYKLLDNGYWIVMYHNGHGSITAAALGESESDTINDVRECIEECIESEDRIAVNETPTKALATLVEQMA